MMSRGERLLGQSRFTVRLPVVRYPGNALPRGSLVGDAGGRMEIDIHGGGNAETPESIDAFGGLFLRFLVGWEPYQ